MGGNEWFTTVAYHFQLVRWAYLQCIEPTEFWFSSIEQLDFKDLEDRTTKEFCITTLQTILLKL